MLKSTIKRSEWNGNTLGPVYASRLLDHAGRRCCLGFAGRDAGLSNLRMLDVAYVHGLQCDVPESLMLLVERGWGVTGGESQISHTLTEANDNNREFSSMAEKEAYIIEKGRLAGIEFTFVD